MAASFWETGGTYLAVLTPLVAVPLTVITFYLRSLQETQVNWRADFVRRIDGVEGGVADVRKLMVDFERDYATKEEWLRECMHARGRLEHLSQSVARLEALRGDSDERREHLGSIH
ncbi:MAG: hypothetical protein HY287_04235 [Planctomycetes bacterium]|nr:hypothetical protein [Planctomycetota bacterium]MBI3833522.1 hypothetical protein [Planctomycetota bacterium]